VSDLAELRSRLFRSSAAHCIFSAEARRLLRPIPESGNTASNPHLSRATRASRNALLCAFRQVNKPFQAALRPDRERQRIAKGGNFLEARSRARRKISGRNTAERRCSRQVRVARIARHYRGFTAKTNPTVRLNGWTFKTPYEFRGSRRIPRGVPLVIEGSIGSLLDFGDARWSSGAGGGVSPSHAILMQRNYDKVPAIPRTLARISSISRCQAHLALASPHLRRRASSLSAIGGARDCRLNFKLLSLCERARARTRLALLSRDCSSARPIIRANMRARIAAAWREPQVSNQGESDACTRQRTAFESGRNGGGGGGESR